MKRISVAGLALIAMVLMTAPSCRTTNHHFDGTSFGWGVVGGIAGELIFEGGKWAWNYIEKHPPTPAKEKEIPDTTEIAGSVN